MTAQAHKVQSTLRRCVPSSARGRAADLPRRTVRALWQSDRAVSLGEAATEAAYAAGFSDAAHLTRTFRKLMGIAPSFVKID